MANTNPGIAPIPRATPARSTLTRQQLEEEALFALDEIGSEALESGEVAPSLDALLMTELGLDSIEHVELVSLAWQRFGLGLGAPRPGAIHTLRHLIDLASTELGSSRGGN